MHQQNRRADQDQRTSMHSPWSSTRACRKMPSAHTHTYRGAALLSAFVVHYGVRVTNRFSSISIA
jgi:hypothetical protein